MQSNSGKIKIIKSNKSLDLTKPKYKQDNKKHAWLRVDKRKTE